MPTSSRPTTCTTSSSSAPAALARRQRGCCPRGGTTSCCSTGRACPATRSPPMGWRAAGSSSYRVGGCWTRSSPGVRRGCARCCSGRRSPCCDGGAESAGVDHLLAPRRVHLDAVLADAGSRGGRRACDCGPLRPDWCATTPAGCAVSGPAMPTDAAASSPHAGLSVPTGCARGRRRGSARGRWRSFRAGRRLSTRTYAATGRPTSCTSATAPSPACIPPTPAKGACG